MPGNTSARHLFILWLISTLLFAVLPAAAQTPQAEPVFTATPSETEHDIITMRNDAVRKTTEQIRGVWRYQIAVVDDRPITVGKIVSAIILLSLAIWLSKGVSSLLGRLFLPKLGLKDGGLMAVQSIIFYLLIAFFALFALRLANVPLTMFTVIGGALAIGLGFGSQNIMSNFISGLIMLVEQHVRVGDLIEVDKVQGTVKHVGPRSTTVRTGDNIDIVVPNSQFLDKHVVNWTLPDNMIRATLEVHAAYESDVKLITGLLLQAAEENLHVLETPPPGVLLHQFGQETLEFQLYFHIFLVSITGMNIVKSELRYRILELFREHEISMMLPQRDLRVEVPEKVKVQMTDKSG